MSKFLFVNVIDFSINFRLFFFIFISVDEKKVTTLCVFRPKSLSKKRIQVIKKVIKLSTKSYNINFVRVFVCTKRLKP